MRFCSHLNIIGQALDLLMLFLLVKLKESKHRETILKLEKQLDVEKAARMQSEEAQMKFNVEISRVTENLERAYRDERELRKTHGEITELLKRMIQEKKDEENRNKNNCIVSELTSAIEHKVYFSQDLLKF